MPACSQCLCVLVGLQLNRLSMYLPAKERFQPLLVDPATRSDEDELRTAFRTSPWVSDRDFGAASGGLEN